MCTWGGSCPPHGLIVEEHALKCLLGSQRSVPKCPLGCQNTLKCPLGDQNMCYSALLFNPWPSKSLCTPLLESPYCNGLTMTRRQHIAWQVVTRVEPFMQHTLQHVNRQSVSPGKHPLTHGANILSSLLLITIYPQNNRCAFSRKYLKHHLIPKHIHEP